MWKEEEDYHYSKSRLAGSQNSNILLKPHATHGTVITARYM